MKEGAGEDPFAEDDGEATAENGAGADPPEQAGTGGSDGGTMRIPYKFRRDSVQAGRDRVPLFLHPETKRAERDALRELEERFGDDVSLTDLREALVKAGLDHLDEVENHLEEWGYGMTFEE